MWGGVLIGRAGRRPLSPRMRLKDGPDSTVCRSCAPVRARPVRSHVKVTGPSALRHRLRASASVSGAAHSIEAEPTSPCSHLAPSPVRAASHRRVVAVLPERARRRRCLLVSVLPPCLRHLLSWWATAGLPRPPHRVARSSPAAPPSLLLPAMPRASLSSSTKVTLGSSAIAEPLPFLLQ
jgi:hypothetical protein